MEAAGRIYVACPAERIERARAVARRLEEEGFQVISRWHRYDRDDVVRAADLAELHRLVEAALVERNYMRVRDLSDLMARGGGAVVQDAPDVTVENRADLAEADALVALTDRDVGRELYIEIGLALSAAIPIVWSQEKGGAAPSLIADPAVLPVLRDADVANMLRPALGGFRSMRQIAAGRMG